MKIPLGKGRKMYVAGPYRAGTDYLKVENIWHAIKASVMLWELNWVVFCPHANTANFDIFSKLSPEVYLNGDIEFLKECEAIYLLKGWESSEGSKRELEIATERKMLIYYE